MTQTALLHQKGNRVSTEKLEEFLGIYETSSPSYLLMGGISYCLRFLEEQGAEQFELFSLRMKKARKQLSAMKTLHLTDRDFKKQGNIFDMDLSKFVISTVDAPVNGPQLHEILRTKYHLEMEMTGGTYVLAMTTVADTQEGLDRLKAALLEIDGQLEAKTAVSGSIEISGELPRLEQYFTPQEAADREEDGEAEEIPWKESEGHISLEYAYLYPPGSPVIVPGERISREAVELLCYYETQNLQIEGIQTEGKIKVWKHE